MDQKEDEDGERVGNVGKAVSIAEPPEAISPMILGRSKYVEEPLELDRQISSSSRQFKAGIGGRRLQGRPSLERFPSVEDAQLLGRLHESMASSAGGGGNGESIPGRHHMDHEGFISQVAKWLKHERERRASRKSKRRANKAAVDDVKAATAAPPGELQGESASRRGSESSDGSVALENLAALLEKTLSTSPTTPRAGARRKSSGIKPRRRSTGASSDTDYFDGEPLVPSTDVVLDNSKTLAYPRGGEHVAEEVDEAQKGQQQQSPKDREAWSKFKYEIVRLAHTLGLRGWRRVPLGMTDQVHVERMSGALTNAVYFVSPPKKLPPRRETKSPGGSPQLKPTNPPQKLLLRIYGPQVDHLIDRTAELQVLRRLALKKIGPRLLGTFANGRFEEYLHARPLTAKELRSPETSKQIAKRMRELHEGIDLLPEERRSGPFVWRNWDSWLDRCEKIVTWLDEQVDASSGVRSGSKGEGAGQHKGEVQKWYVCGTKWTQFRKTLEKYREWLDKQYGGRDKVNERLLFAHNDTQYGNILRLQPSGESPLLLPANEHKQLVVIDFEYANANLAGYEFANHFSEWCYNYHDSAAPESCTTLAYPRPDEQRRFVRAYVSHQPAFSSSAAATPTATHPNRQGSGPPTPSIYPTVPSLSSSISTFVLDSRAPPPGASSVTSAGVAGASFPSLSSGGGSAGGAAEGGQGEGGRGAMSATQASVEAEVDRLLAETRLWRLACSAMWVAWGVVQAKVPGMEAADAAKEEKGEAGGDGDERGGEQRQGTGGSSDVPPSDRARDRGADAERDPAADADGEGEGAAEGGEDKEEEKEEDKDDADEHAFDYLAYAHERALFFWGDALRMGFVGEGELPAEVRGRAKVVEY